MNMRQPPKLYLYEQIYQHRVLLSQISPRHLPTYTSQKATLFSTPFLYGIHTWFYSQQSFITPFKNPIKSNKIYIILSLLLNYSLKIFYANFLIFILSLYVYTEKEETHQSNNYFIYYANFVYIILCTFYFHKLCAHWDDDDVMLMTVYSSRLRKS